MITPLFKASQDDTHVIVVVRTPHVKADELDLEVGRHVVKFYVKPYYLSLTFKQSLQQEGKETASWDVGKGEMTVKLPKARVGEHFENLDMLTELLSKAKPRPAPAGRGVSEIPGEGEEEDGEEEEESDYEGPADWEYNWEEPQRLPEPEAAEELMRQVKYGFNRMYQGVFKDRQDFQKEVLDLKDPDYTPEEERRSQREDEEDAKMEEEYGQFLYDTLLNQETIVPLLKLKMPWEKEATKKPTPGGAAAEGTAPESNVATRSEGGFFGDDVTVERDVDYTKMDEEEEQEGGGAFTHEERETLIKLPRRKYMMSKEEKKRALIGLVDILYGYAYDMRTTECEPTCESGWTVCKLSTMLSWLDTCDSVKHALAMCLRRALVYPLYRTWDLACKVVEDVACIVSLGRVWVLRALLKVKRLLATSSERYLLNNIVVDDYCCWLQGLGDDKAAHMMQSLSAHLRSVKLEKSITGWDLEEMEREGRAEVEGGGGGEECEMEDLRVAEEAAGGSESSESGSSESSSESSSEEEEKGGGGGSGVRDAAEGLQELSLGAGSESGTCGGPSVGEEESGLGCSSDAAEASGGLSGESAGGGQGEASSGEVIDLYPGQRGLLQLEPEEDGDDSLGVGSSRFAGEEGSEEAVSEASAPDVWRPVGAGRGFGGGKKLVEVLSEDDYLTAKARILASKRRQLSSMPSAVSWMALGRAGGK